MSHEEPGESPFLDRNGGCIYDAQSPYRYFGARLARARRRAMKTLQMVADETGASVATLSKWEAGEVRNPHPRTMRAVAVSLGLDPVERIFDWQDENERLLLEAARAKSFTTATQRGRDLELLSENGEAIPDDEGCSVLTAPYRYFGARLARARRRAGMTLKILAEESGTSQQVLSEWEIGNVKNPHPRKLRAVANALGINPVERIFDWMDENERLLREETIGQSLIVQTTVKSETKNKKRPRQPGFIGPSGLSHL